METTQTQPEFIPLGGAPQNNEPPRTEANDKKDDKHRDRERDRDRDRDRDRRDDKRRDKDDDRRSRRDRRSRSRSPPRRRSRSRSPRSRDRDPPRRRSPERGGSSSSAAAAAPVRQRKSAWDQAPAGFEGMNVQQVAKLAPAALTPAAANASRQSRRLYIGNIPGDLTELELMEFMNTAMLAAKVTLPGRVGPPVVACQMNREKSFAFIEMRSSEEANAGMAFDGITLKGYALKVRRPRDYAGDPGALGAAPVEDFPEQHIPGIVATNVPDSEHKIFCGGLPSYVTEEQVKLLFSPFGQLKAFNLVKDTTTGNSKGFAFLEFVDHSVTDKACEGLNGLKIGDKTLLVQRSQNAKKGEARPANPGAAPSMQNPTALNFLNLQMPIPTILSALTAEQAHPPVTRVVTLMNLFTVEELANDDDYADFTADLEDEARKIGDLLRLVVPRPALAEPPAQAPPSPTSIPLPPPPRKLLPAPGVGRVFLEYATTEQAQRAQLSFAGRKFNKRTVITAFYPEDLWQEGRLDGPDEKDTRELK